MGRERIGEAGVRWSYNATARMLAAFGLKEVVRRQLLPRIVGVLQSTENLGALAAAESYIDDEIARVVRTPGPIIAGPWLSEVGFELLYWIPLLRWISAKWELEPERVVVVSRGGTASWYQGICGRYLDIFAWTDPKQFSAINRARWQREQRQKQFVPLTEDEEFILRARKAIGVRECGVLHPSLMYRLFAPVFDASARFQNLRCRVRYERMAKPELPAGLRATLPPEYVAVRFYFRPSFPDTPSNRAFIRHLLDRLSAQAAVVMLNTGLEVDDHADCPADGSLTLEGKVTPTDNLDVQTRIIANAKAFVGTYGGLSYLPGFLGVPSIGFHSIDADLKSVHLHVAQTACSDLGSRFVNLHVDDMGLLDRIGLTVLSS